MEDSTPSSLMSRHHIDISHKNSCDARLLGRKTRPNDDRVHLLDLVVVEDSSAAG